MKQTETKRKKKTIKHKKPINSPVIRELVTEKDLKTPELIKYTTGT